MYTLPTSLGNEGDNYSMKEQRTFLPEIGIIYLAVPAVLFTFGWFEWWAALGIWSLILYGFGRRVSQNEYVRGKYARKDWEIVLPCLTIFVLYLFFAGLTGNWHQQPDYYVRNDIFYSLAFEKWPLVTDDGRLFIYYFQSYLPAALLGKLCGWSAIQWLFYLWLVVGAFLLVLVAYRKLGKMALFLFVFYMVQRGLDGISSGLILHFLDGVPCSEAFLFQEHALDPFVYVSSITVLKNFPHAAVPVLLAFALLLDKKTAQQYGYFIGVLVVMYSPMTSIVFLPCLAYLYLRSFGNSVGEVWRAVPTLLREAVHPLALGSILAAALLWMPYYLLMEAQAVPTKDVTFQVVFRYASFVIFNAGILTACIYAATKDWRIILLCVLHALCLSAVFYLFDIAYKGAIVWGMFSSVLLIPALRTDRKILKYIIGLYVLSQCVITLALVPSLFVAFAVAFFVWLILHGYVRYAALAFSGVCMILLCSAIVKPTLFHGPMAKLKGEEARYSTVIGINQPEANSGMRWWYRFFPREEELPVWFKRSE